MSMFRTFNVQASEKHALWPVTASIASVYTKGNVVDVYGINWSAHYTDIRNRPVGTRLLLEKEKGIHINLSFGVVKRAIHDFVQVVRTFETLDLTEENLDALRAYYKRRRENTREADLRDLLCRPQTLYELTAFRA